MRDSRSWSAAAVLRLIADTQFGLIIFDDKGYCVFCTKNVGSLLSHINTFSEFLAEMRISEPAEYLLHQRSAFFYLRRRSADGALWRGHIQRGHSLGATLLLLEDVTEKYSGERIKQVLLEQAEKTPDGIGIADQEQNLLYINQGMRQLIGFPQDARCNDYRIKHFHPEGMSGVSVEEALRHSQRGPYCFETVLGSVDGKHKKRVLQMLMAHPDPIDHSLQYSTVVHDISEAHQLREELANAQSQLEGMLEKRTRELESSTRQAQYSQQLWRSLVDHNLDLVLFTNQRGEILFANQGFLQVGGADLLGRFFFDFVAAQDRECLYKVYSALMAGVESHCSREMILIFAEREYYCIAHINRIEQLNDDHAATWVIADITAEREIRHQIALNEQMAATGRMAARVAHEINNPLAAIMSSMALVKMDIDANSEAANYIALMENELERVSNIIRQMYGLYRPEQIPTQYMPLEDIIRECCILLMTDARAKGIDLECEFRRPVSAVVSEGNLRQILYNVILNAVDASPEHETVLITLDCDENTASICVRDKGKGMSEDIAKRLFEPFFTTKDTYSGMELGLGLGLPVSLSLVREMGGDLSLSPAEGGGTLCRVTLPVT